jgi:hypothetical protein
MLDDLVSPDPFRSERAGMWMGYALMRTDPAFLDTPKRQSV